MHCADSAASHNLAPLVCMLHPSTVDLALDVDCSWIFSGWLGRQGSHSRCLSELISMDSLAPHARVGIGCRSSPHLEGLLMFDQGLYFKRLLDQIPRMGNIESEFRKCFVVLKD
jgi:hypothetical protein